MTNEGVVTEICPPLPGVRSATAVMEKGGLFRAPSTSSQPALSGKATPCLLIAATSAAKSGVAFAAPKRATKIGLSLAAKTSSGPGPPVGETVGGGAVKLMIPPFAPDMVSDFAAVTSTN